MFNLIGLPLTSNNQILNDVSTIPIVSLTTSNNAVPTVVISSNAVETKVNQTSAEPYNTVVNLNTVSTGSEVVSIVINDPSLYQIQDIEIYGRKYTRTFESVLSEGSFNIDPVTKELQIFLRSNNFTTDTPIKINGSKKKLITNEVINVPGFISEYGLVGNISISRGFQDHPSCTFSLVANSESIAQIELLFNAHKYQHLFTKKFVFFDIPFRIRTFTSNLTKSQETLGERKIQVNFEGWYRYLVDKSITVRPGVPDSNTPGKFVECNINTNNKLKTATIGSNTDPNKIKIGLGQLAGNAGLSYAGSAYYFEVDKNTPNDAVTTFSSELNKILPSKSEFAIYSNPSGILTRKWNGVSSFVIDEADILSDCPVNYNAELVSYAPGVLTWKDNSRNDTSTGGSEDGYKNEAPEFEYKPPKRSVVVTGETNPTVPPANLQSIQTLDMNYDQSGEKKVQIITTYEGSTVIQETTKTYGLAFTASEIYRNGKLFGGAATFWKLVEETTISHLYDNNTGYYLGNNVTGKKLVRFLQETDELESVTYANSTSEVEKAKLQAMQFRYIPVTGHTRYLLRQHKDYYKDQAFKHPYIIYPWCTANGTLTYLKIKDPTYADDLFVGMEETYKHCFASIQNPENLEDPEIKLPPLTTGEIFYSSVKTQVCASKSVYESGTTFSDPIVGSDFDNPEERYVTYSKQSSAQDTNFMNSLEEVNTSMSTGRPSVASRRPSDYVAVTDESLEPLRLNTLSGGSITTKLRETKVNNSNPNSSETQHIVYTTPFTGTSPVTSSYSFEYAESLSEALEAVKTQLNIQKTQQEVTLNITTLFNNYLLEGSKYSFIYLDAMYNCRILSINHNLDIQGIDEFGELIVTGNSSLQLGVEQYSVINNYTKLVKSGESSDDNNPNPNFINIFNPHYVGKTLGTLVDIARTYPISRGNFR